MKYRSPKKLPFLEAIFWQTKDVCQFTPEQMLSRYELTLDFGEYRWSGN